MIAEVVQDDNVRITILSHLRHHWFFDHQSPSSFPFLMSIRIPFLVIALLFTGCYGSRQTAVTAGKNNAPYSIDELERRLALK